MAASESLTSSFEGWTLFREICVLTVAETSGILRARALFWMVATFLALTVLAPQSTVFWIDAPSSMTRSVALDFAWMSAGVTALLGMYCHQLHGNRPAPLMEMRLRSIASIPLAGIIASVSIGIVVWCLSSGVACIVTPPPSSLAVGWGELAIRTLAFVMLVATLSCLVSTVVRPAIAAPLCLALVAASLVGTPWVASRLGALFFLWPDFTLSQLARPTGTGHISSFDSFGLACAQSMLFVCLALTVNAIRRT